MRIHIMRKQSMRKHASLLLFGSLLLATTLGCGTIGFIDNLPPLAGVSYWAAETATPIPTVTVFLGMTTPVYAATPIPAVITLPPAWTTVTATPIVPPATMTPWGFTATPFWATTTAVYITETPVPPVTTTPALPRIGYSTPEPIETPYYRVGSFYMNSDVTIGGANGLIFRLIAHERQPNPNNNAAVYHFLTIQVTNTSSEETIVPLSDLLFIRQVEQEGEQINGRWTAQNEPLIARSLPTYDAQQLTAIPPDGMRTVVIGFVLPAGELHEVGLITDWNRPVEGGLPIWFLLENDPLGPFVDAYKPAPPTPIVLDEGGTQGGNGGGLPGGGDGLWPTTGTVTRGYGCAVSYTGIDGAGFGCPLDRPWFHNGVDVANTQGTAVWSPIIGSIIYAGPNSTGPDCSAIPGSQAPHEGLGNYQKVSDGQTLHYFGHLSGFSVTGGAVTAGQSVAQMGSTGCSTGSHLHWMVYENSSLIDPAIWAGPGP